MPKSLGFTLVEILIAISILAIAAVVSVPTYRNYNESQVLKNAQSDLISNLKSAQTNAQTGAKCADGSANTDWAVMLNLNSSTFQIKCYPNNSSNTKQVSFSPQITVNSVSLSGYSCILFMQNNIFYTSDCTVANSSASLGPETITLIDSNIKSSNTKDIRIEKGGAIYAVN